jgi:hypothetical protein
VQFSQLATDGRDAIIATNLGEILKSGGNPRPSFVKYRSTFIGRDRGERSRTVNAAPREKSDKRPLRPSDSGSDNSRKHRRCTRNRYDTD